MINSCQLFLVLVHDTISVSLFPHAEVVKKTSEIMLTAKAWNGRVICQWLAALMPTAVSMLGVGQDDGRFTLTCHAVILDYI